MKKVCIVTTARSEYGLLRWIIDGVYNNPMFELQLIVTGSHLNHDQGYTIDFIKEDGYPFIIVDVNLNNTSHEDIACSMGHLSINIAKAFSQLKPDILVVLGDRFELLPICSSALVFGIPIAHISGGDITEGAIDDDVRNAISMMAKLHFPGTEDSAKNIARMKGSWDNIYNVGEPGLDNFNNVELMSRLDLACNIGININKKWVLLTYHPETKISIECNLFAINNILDALRNIEDTEVVITKANVDYGGREINSYIEDYIIANNLGYKLYGSLGQIRYLSYLKQCWCLIGNSSSGIVEAPSLHIPVINVGNRQKGRFLCSNIISIDNTYEGILKALKGIDNFTFSNKDSNYWGDGHSAKKIINILGSYG